jgi:hypothetical protein
MMDGMDLGMQGLKQQQSDNVSIFELESEILIDRIKHQLRGDVFDPNNNCWVQTYKPHVNEEGIGKFVFIISGMLDKNITLSHLDLDKIYRMSYEICTAIIGLIFRKSKEYEIAAEDRDLILNIIEQQIFSTLMRAKDGGERTHRETIIKSVENVVDKQTHTQARTGSILASLNPFKKTGRFNQEGEI